MKLKYKALHEFEIEQLRQLPWQMSVFRIKEHFKTETSYIIYY